jgi:hypothetical protein
MLQDFRSAAEAACASKAEQIKKDVIYAMHVIRYAGGILANNTSFGLGASSYNGRGNSLTGVSELDDFRLPNTHSYAQVAVQDLPGAVDPHLAKLEKMLEDSKSAFDALVQQTREEFADKVAVEVAEAAAYAERAKSSYSDQAQLDRDDLDVLIADVKAWFDENNAARKAQLQELTSARLSAFEMVMEAKITKIQGWIIDRLEWVEKMDESYLKEHLTKELKAQKASITEQLEARIATARADAAQALDELWEGLQGLREDLAEYGADQSSGLGGYVLASRLALNIALDALNEQFDDAAQAELDGLMAKMDEKTQNWAYWLKYQYGYQGYETSLYQDFDPSRNYENIMGYADGDGAYADLGSQGPDASNGGLSNLSAHGVGGRGGHDHLYSGDHTALAYGKEIGPNRDFIGGSILDPRMEEMMASYASGMFHGLDY